MKLRPYQHEAVEAVYRHLRELDDNPCVVIPTGGGKTPMMATICDDAVTRWNGRVIVLAHVKELLEQTAGTLAGMAPHLDIGVYSAGLKRRDTEHAVIVAGIQSVYRRAAELDAFDLVMVDECFPAGTLVDGQPIETIQPGQWIRSLNHATGAIEYRRVLATRRRPLPSRMVRVTLANGRTITCTPNHPFFTGREYAPAQSLMEIPVVYMPRMRRGHSKPDSQPIQGVPASRADVLREGVFDSEAKPSQFTQNDRGQPHAGPGYTPEGLRDLQADGLPSGHPERQRARADQAAADVAGSPRPGVGDGVRHQDGPAQGRRQRDVVRRRSGASADQDLRRGGRRLAQVLGRPGSGRATGCDLEPVGVANVEVFQRGDPRRPGESSDGDYVYNLQVEGNENYFANDVLVHNCHMIPPEGEGMYRQFLADATVVNPWVRVIGLTATPFRMTTGMICEPENLLNHVCYEVGVKELIRDGYLCQLRTRAGTQKADTSGLHIRGGEFIPGEVEDLMDSGELVRSACAEVVEHTEDRRSCLIFASGIRHGRHIQQTLEDGHGVRCGFICGETPSAERDELLGQFRDGELKYLCNVNVLTTGFDAPNIDCVAMLRPTMSPGLYYQMVGRGFRLHPNKTDCLVLDFGGNVLRHGPVDAIRITEPGKGDGEAPAKECPECHAVIAAGYAACPECGYEFPERQRAQHDASASTEGILSGQTTVAEHAVQDVFYSVHTKRDAAESDPKTMRVEYRIGWQDYRSEWICFEHDGWAKHKASTWWRQRSAEPVPATAAEAVDLCERGGICETPAIKVKSTVGEKYDRIVGYQLGNKPARLDAGDLAEPVADYAWAGDEVPF